MTKEGLTEKELAVLCYRGSYRQERLNCFPFEWRLDLAKKMNESEWKSKLDPESSDFDATILKQFFDGDLHILFIDVQTEGWEAVHKSLPGPQRGHVSYFYGIRCQFEDVPQWINGLTTLTSLNLSWNQLSSLPVWLAGMTALTSLDLSRNQLSSLPESMGGMTALTSLNLSENQLSSLQESMGKMTALTSLDLSRNKLSSLPESMGGMTALTSLYLSENQLSSLPEAMGGMTALTSLNLSWNQLSSLPESMGGMTALTSLNLRWNQLRSLPESMGGMTALTSLNLSENQLSSLQESMGKMTALTSLDLSRNKLSSLPESMGGMTALTSLNLSVNQLSSLPESMGGMTALTSLDLSQNVMTKGWGEVVVRERELILTGKRLTSLPSWITTLTFLTSLHLGGNQLSSLPESMGGMTALNSLDLSENQLSSLPESTGGMTALTSLNLSGNQLTSLPNSIGDLKSLTSLNLSDNDKLTSLPSSVRHLQSLGELYIPCNEIHGLFSSTTTWTLEALSPLGLLPEHVNVEGIPESVFPPAVRRDQLQYLRQLCRGELSPNDRARLFLVGQEGTGKSTLQSNFAKQSKKYLVKPGNPSTRGIAFEQFKLNGVELAQGNRLDIQVDVLDTAGQAEYHGTHRLFLRTDAVYLMVFRLTTISTASHAGHVYLDRLKFWLRSVYGAAPVAQVILVGTHADDSRCTNDYLRTVREKINNLISMARHDHDCAKEYQVSNNCLICNEQLHVCMNSGHISKNAANTSSTSESGGISSEGHSFRIPHIVGYLELLANADLRPAYQLVRSAISRLPHIGQPVPFAWKECERWLQEERNRLVREYQESRDSGAGAEQYWPAIELTSIREKAQTVGVDSDDDWGFMKRVLIDGYGNFVRLNETVFLDREWVAGQLKHIFNVENRHSAWVQDGVIKNTKVQEIWPHLSGDQREKMLELSRQFRLTFPMTLNGTPLEVIPSCLPFGIPSWAEYSSDERILVRRYQLVNFDDLLFASLIAELVGKLNLTNGEPRFCRYALVLPIVAPNAENRVRNLLRFAFYVDEDVLELVVRSIDPGPRKCMEHASGIIEEFLNELDGVSYSTWLVCPFCHFDGLAAPSLLPPMKDLQATEASSLTDIKVQTCPKDTHGANPEKFYGDLVEGAVDLAATSNPSPGSEGDSPTLFVVLPDRVDGFLGRVVNWFGTCYRLHFLCEGYMKPPHEVSHPGYRVQNVKEFFRKYSVHIRNSLNGLAVTGMSTSVPGSMKCFQAADMYERIIRPAQQFPGKIKFAHQPVTQIMQADVGSASARSLHAFLKNFDPQNGYAGLHETQPPNPKRWLCEQCYNSYMNHHNVETSASELVAEVYRVPTSKLVDSPRRQSAAEDESFTKWKNECVSEIRDVFDRVDGTVQNSMRANDDPSSHSEVTKKMESYANFLQDVLNANFAMVRGINEQIKEQIGDLQRDQRFGRDQSSILECRVHRILVLRMVVGVDVWNKPYESDDASWQYPEPLSLYQTDKGDATSAKFRLNEGKPHWIVLRVEHPMLSEIALTAKTKPTFGIRVMCISRTKVRKDITPDDSDALWTFPECRKRVISTQWVVESTETDTCGNIVFSLDDCLREPDEAVQEAEHGDPHETWQTWMGRTEKNHRISVKLAVGVFSPAAPDDVEKAWWIPLDPIPLKWVAKSGSINRMFQRAQGDVRAKLRQHRRLVDVGQKTLALARAVFL